MDVLAEAFGFIGPKQLKSSAPVTAVFTESPSIYSDAVSDYESIDDYVGNDQFDDDDSFIVEGYPVSHLVYLEPKAKRSEELKQKIHNLIYMKSVDDDFKMKLYLEKDLKRLFLSRHTDQISSKDITTEVEKQVQEKQVQEIEDALVHRLLFAVRQRRLVTKLVNKGLLANSETAWCNATFELDLTSKIVWCWHTKRLLPLSKALLTELNCDMKDDDFDSGVRRLLTEELNRDLVWNWLSEKGSVSRGSAVKAVVETCVTHLPSVYDDSASESDDGDEDEDEEDEAFVNDLLAQMGQL
jgi:hypothetical protein